MEPDPEPVYDEPRMVYFVTYNFEFYSHSCLFGSKCTPDLENCDAITIIQFVRRFAWPKGEFLFPICLIADWYDIFRTHLHDLEVIVCHLRSAVKDESGKLKIINYNIIIFWKTFFCDVKAVSYSWTEKGIPESVLTILYSLFDPVYAFHKDFLSQLEQRVAEWEVEEMKGKFFTVK